MSHSNKLPSFLKPSKTTLHYSQHGRPYLATVSDSGTWINSQGTDFLFAFVEEGWDSTFKTQIGVAFETALNIPNLIKKAVLDTSGQTVVDGLYLQNQPAMTKAMNSIKGMAMTTADTSGNSGTNTAVQINLEFFAQVLAGLEGDISSISSYLTNSMATFQTQLSNTSSTDNFGTIIGLVSGLPELGVITTSFQYVFANGSEQTFVVKSNCHSSQQETYNYNYTNVTYVYDPLGLQAKK